MMIVQYLLDADERVVIPGVAAPQTAFADVVEPVGSRSSRRSASPSRSRDAGEARARGGRPRRRAVPALVPPGAARGGLVDGRAPRRRRALARQRDADRGLPRARDGRGRGGRRERAACRPAGASLSKRAVGIAARTCSATASISTAAPVTSLSSSSAVGFCPSAQRSVRSRPASRRLNQSLPNSSRRKLVICAANAHARRYDGDVVARVDVGEIVRRARLDLERVAEQLDVAAAHLRRIGRRVELELVEQLRAVAADVEEQLHGALGRERLRSREVEHAAQPGAIVDQVVEEHRPALGDGVVAEALLLHLQVRRR